MDKMEQWEADWKLARACRSGRVSEIRDLLEAGGNPNFTMSSNDFSCLHQAVMRGSDDIINLLLDYGADVNKADERYFNRTALFSAVTTSSQATITLLERGADPYVIDSQGNTPLFLAASEGLLESVKILLDRGVEVNFRNSAGCTALHWVAAEKKNFSHVADFLIERGANVNAKNDRGFTPLTHNEWMEGNEETRSVIEKRMLELSMKNVPAKSARLKI